MIEPYFRSLDRNFTLLHGDCRKLLRNFDFKFNCIFADPPYFLSKGGISIQSGKIVCVNKGDWDKGKTHQEMMEFNMDWIKLCHEKLKDNGFWIYATDMDGEEYTKVEYAEKTVLVIGAEGTGVSKRVGDNSDFIISIPMFGKINSLNASVAAGIAIYEVVRQRKQG